jgi:AcrR family transcriptional regulator
MVDIKIDISEIICCNALVFKIFHKLEGNMKNDNMTRQIILKAALDCFTKYGGIYWHFKSKEEMFVQLIEEEYEPWLNTVRSALATTSDPIEKLKKYGELFYSQIDLPVFKMIPESYWGDVGEHYRDRLNQCYSQDNELIYAVFTEAIAKNQVRITDAKALTWIYISMLEGLFAELSLEWDNKDKDELVKYFEQGINIFIDGIRVNKDSD